MMEDNYLQKNRKKPFWSYILFVLGVLLLIFIISATLFGLIFLQTVDESLDFRKQALEVSKRVDFDTYPFNQSFFKVQDPSRIELQINTYNHNIDALELSLYIETDLGLWRESDLQINDSNLEQLELVKAEIQQIECDQQHDCYLATLLLTSTEASMPFTSRNLSTSIASLEFIPQKEGAISLQLNQASQVTEHGTGQNILQNPSSIEFTYYVSDNGIDFAQCQYLYEEWSECKNFWQTRQFRVAPLNCHWHQQETLEKLNQRCLEKETDNVLLANDQDFFLHYFRSCLNSENQGENFYLLWDIEQYPGFDWIDVSPNHLFSSFYQKSIAEAQKIDNYAVINLANFRGFTQDLQGQTLVLRADQNYYFRLYNDQTDEFVIGPKLYLAYCDTDLSQHRDCQKSCDLSRENGACLEGLICIDGYCRLADSPENQWCLDPNLIGKGPTVGSVAGVSTQLSDARFIIQGPFLPSEVYDITTYDCNHGCNTNRDCMPNYRCFEGRCRLAINPQSPTCEEAEIIIQSIEVTKQKGFSPENDQELGDDSFVDSDAKTEIDTSTSSAAAEDLETVKKDSSSILNNLSTSFGNFLSNLFTSLFGTFNWQLLALVGLIITIALVFMILSLIRDPQERQRRKNKKLEKRTAQTETKIQEKEEEQIIPENDQLDL